ncbi:MAG: dehydrogenase, partial [Saprospiraceae bacterium]
MTDKYDLPDGKKENVNLKMYADAIQKIAAKNKIPFLDVFSPTQKWFASGEQLTIDGFQLNDLGYQKFAKLLVDQTFGNAKPKAESHRDLVLESVLEKNWFWHDDFKSP